MEETMQDRIKDLEDKIVFLEDKLIRVQERIDYYAYELEKLAISNKVLECERFAESCAKDIKKLHVLQKNNKKAIYSLLKKRIDVAYWERCEMEIDMDSVPIYDLYIGKEMLDKIIARGYCICGKPIENDESCKKELLSLRNSMELYNCIYRNIFYECKLRKEIKKGIDEEYMSIEKSRVEINEKLYEKEALIQEVHTELKGMPFAEECAYIKKEMMILKEQEKKIKVDIFEKQKMLELYKRKAER